jgi:hypothetical protein
VSLYGSSGLYVAKLVKQLHTYLFMLQLVSVLWYDAVLSNYISSNDILSNDVLSKTLLMTFCLTSFRLTTFRLKTLG